MNAKSRPTRAVVLLTAVFSFTLACKFEPRAPELKYSLNAAVLEENEALVDDAVAQARLQGALEYLFGTPQGPSFLQLPEWEDEEFYANSIGLDFLYADDDWYDQLVASNEHAYRNQLESLAAATSLEELQLIGFPRYSEELGASLEGLFAELEADEQAAGSPDANYYEDEDGNPVSYRSEADYMVRNYYPSLQASARMYRMECYHCHGPEGGGNGSTAPYLNPRPRDYRPGKFKHIPLADKARPRHQDLFRILAEGLYTSAMPNFRRFSDAQLHGLSDYVRLLAARGETEILLISDYDPDEGGFTPELVQDTYKFVMDRWRSNTDKLITFDGEIPEATPERIAHGRYLFATPGEQGGANCVSCHGSDGRGNGASAKEIDPVTNEPRWVKDEWGNEIRPRNLTAGVFRLGRRPIDLYRRVYAGINGTPMPAHYDMEITDQDGTRRRLNEDDVWDLVFFVQSLSTHAKVETRRRTEDHGTEEGGH